MKEQQICFQQITRILERLENVRKTYSFLKEAFVSLNIINFSLLSHSFEGILIFTAVRLFFLKQHDAQNIFDFGGSYRYVVGLFFWHVSLNRTCLAVNDTSVPII